MACTTILVGKNASYDGSTIVGRNEDSPSGLYNPKKFIAVKKEEQPKKYKSVLSHVEIDLSQDEAMNYTANPNAEYNEGYWAAFGVNEANVSMTATETITANSRLLGADPLVKLQKAQGKKGEKDYKPEVPGGIGEEDLVTLVLPYIHSAREGVYRLGKLLEEYGTYEMNGIAFQDEDEIWWLETLGGHHFMARRVPDDSYVVMPNQLGIDRFNFKDAFNEAKDYICSKDLKDFILEHHLGPDKDVINPRLVFGTKADSDRTYNTARAWSILKRFNPRTSKWEGPEAEYKPTDFDLPWCLKPEFKLTVEDLKAALSDHYQFTDYDPYEHKDTPFRPIGISRTNELGIVQIRPYGQPLEWKTYGSNVFNALIPTYTHVLDTPKYFRDTTNKLSLDSFYWANRLIGALADPHFHATSNEIERYQKAVGAKMYELINKYDQKLKDGADLVKTSEAANQEIADFVKKETDKLLDKVLYIASNKMKNGFARSDA